MASSDPKIGDGAVFTRLLLKHERQMRSLVRAMVPGCREIDTIIQDASVAMWEKFCGYDRLRPFGPWALSFARMQTMAYLERRKRFAARLSPETLDEIADHAAADSIDRAGRESERLVALDECVAKLSSKETHLLRKRYNDGMTVSEIAEIGEFRASRDALYKTYARLVRRLLNCVQMKTESNR